MPRVGIIGSRRGIDPQLVREFVEKLAAKHSDAVVVSGGAIGVDQAAAAHAKTLGLEFVPHFVERGAWAKDKLAGKRRNWQLVSDCEEVVAFWDGWSNGTAHGVAAAIALGKRVWVYAPSPTGLGIPLA